MFCDTPQVNQLTSLLIAHGINDVVVCPGSRNSTIVHNLNEAGQHFSLHPVTDERSAAFVALGICMATLQPAAVCVTSGSALLGCLPAVAEAYYRHIPLLVISADRPLTWIGQLDGQTLPQNGALQPYCNTYTLEIPHTDEENWANNRRINEAMLALQHNGGGPSHINVPIAEPMFSFTTPALPRERKITLWQNNQPGTLPAKLIAILREARLPALLAGQYEKADIRTETEHLDQHSQMLILPEIIADIAGSWRMNVLDKAQPSDTDLLPDVIIQIGGNFVHKRFKQLLRNAHCHVIRIGQEYDAADTFCHLEWVIPHNEQAVLAQLAEVLPHQHPGVVRAQQAYRKHRTIHTISKKLDFSRVLHALRSSLELKPQTISLHLGNSTAVRQAALIFEAGSFPIFCNRGVNGIEGSLSTATGYAIKMWGLSIALIGDLSFFYDANALWNTRLPDNLRILLFNNGHGAIFDHLPGLEQSPARDTLIAAGQQHYSAEGIAQTFGLNYSFVRQTEQLETTIKHWLEDHGKAHILEIFIEP